MNEETLHSLLAAGVRHGASDIHFRPGAAPMYRVQGKLFQLKYESLMPAHTREIARMILEQQRAEVDLDTVQEFDSSYSLPSTARFRVNMYRQRGSLALVLRIIPSEVPTLESLTLPRVISSIADSERGLVLVTGATGSGKSSTLAAMVGHINARRPAHILTIEDPIEFLHRNDKSSISQRELGADTRNYVTGLRAALRQDPDIILVGEMRDKESVDIALKAAETGHLVLSTVHTTDAAKTIGRIVGMFAPEEQHSVRLRLADNLKATISQRLLPRIDKSGRAVAVEVMVVTGTVKEYLRDADRTTLLKDVIERGRQQYEMQSFDQHLAELCTTGVISVEVAKQAASNPDEFERALMIE